MNPKFSSLPIIDSCDDCGACCQVVCRPPFHRVFDEAGEDAWERLQWERPDLRAEIIADGEASRARGAPDYGAPCLWLDLSTGRCKHYEYRPRACREFAIGGIDCRDARRRAGIAELPQ